MESSSFGSLIADARKLLAQTIEWQSSMLRERLIWWLIIWPKIDAVTKDAHKYDVARQHLFY